MKETFRLSSYVTWSVESVDDGSWLQQNVKEFYSCSGSVRDRKFDFHIKQVPSISVSETAIMVTEGVFLDGGHIFLSDENGFFIEIFECEKKISLRVSLGVAFHYYAKIVDELVKSIAFAKGLLFFHASTLECAGRVTINCSLRRIGKTCLALVGRDICGMKVLSDDAVFFDPQEKKIVPYLRGTDIAPYLKYNTKGMGMSFYIKRMFAKTLFAFPFFKGAMYRVIRKYFMPRINLASVPGQSEAISYDKLVINGSVVSSCAKFRRSPMARTRGIDMFSRASFEEFRDLQNIFKYAMVFHDYKLIPFLSVGFGEFYDRYRSLVDCEWDCCLVVLSREYDCLELVFSD